MLPTTPHWILSLCLDISSHQESQNRVWAVEKSCVCVSVCHVMSLCGLCVCEKKQRREVSINRPASYEPAALPLRYPAFTSHVLCFFAPPFFIFFPFCFFYEDEYKIPSPGIEPGAQT